MAHGLRGRLALLGTSLLFCLGCMDSDPKPIAKPPLKGGPAGSTGPMGSTVKPGPGGPTYSGGQPGAFATSGGRTMGTPPDYTKTGNAGLINGQTVPGQYGSGATLAPAGGTIPAISPQGNSGVNTAGGALPQVSLEPLPGAAPGQTMVYPPQPPAYAAPLK
jgi:hypothetical protein